MGILQSHLEIECDPRLAGELAYSIKEAYRYLWELINATPVLQHPEMRKTYGHIRQALVDVALRLVLEDSSMPVDVQMIAATNNKRNGYTYTMIETKGAIISPVKTRSVRAVPKKALHRSVASIKNKQFDLFTTQEDINKRYDETTPPFMLLTYGGLNHHLQFVQLGLPDVDSEQWIEKVDILNAPRIITSTEQERATQKKLDLTLTDLSEDLRRRVVNGTTNI
ncbi:Uncharacterised protein [Streptococcus pneumoniae]|uniref:Uncharacterized protein n=1 Tax=Streptococcus pneumoniae TaxID=1313 RepID=A0AA86XYY1_STREE|nr:hypothetical protein [Streptococcus pneumoniae]CIO03249.1 Uncharacterised protein [Streptococcus pneumoniae]CIV00948.1 Uncharacterised protein [Streptococcus pneumoniae]